MKRIHLTLSLLLLCIFLYAQDDIPLNPEWKQKGDFLYGAFVGLTSNTLSIPNDNFSFNDQSGNSFMIGGRAEYFLGKNWSIRGGLNYERRNFGRRGFGPDQVLTYITVPVYPTWHFGKNRRWNLGLGLGYAQPLEDIEGFNSTATNIFNIGIIIPISKLRFFIEAEGMTDLRRDEIEFEDFFGNSFGLIEIAKNRSSLNFGIYF